MVFLKKHSINKSIILASIMSLLFNSCAQKQPETFTENWWKETVFYEVYMPSFKDSDGDGFSDFKGLTSKLDYIASLGVKGLWLTPFLESPKVDNGYDVSSYYSIDATYGDLEDFKLLISEAHKRDIKVIMDLVLNHTSTEHEWFKEAVKSKDNPYRDYYIWEDVPNNWESLFGGTAWELDPITNQYYYHQFDVKMADLNWGNPTVRKEIQKVLRFWLDLKVDGFRLDVINFLTTEGMTIDNPKNEKGEQEHLHDLNQKGVKDAMRMIKATVDEYENRFIVGEIGSDKIAVLKQYQGEELLDVVFNFNFGSIPEFSAQRIFDELQSMEKHMSNYPTLFFGSHDMPRLMNRLATNDVAKASALAALMLTAKGVPFIYYGEELGMQNITANSYQEIVDVQGKTHYKLSKEKGLSEDESLKIANSKNRDKSRSPMQWDTSNYSGFSDKLPWIKVQEDYLSANVATLEAEKKSILNTYKDIIAMRNSEQVLQYGTYDSLSLDKNVIRFTRSFKKEKISCYFNFSDVSITIKLRPNETILLGATEMLPNSFLIIKK
ncbi:MAG: alpha-glucosidase [Flavobacteriaceae bacterium]|nr:alpha-glucosidase [Flavobacteriaceae bacterium]